MKNPATGEMEPVDMMVDPHTVPSRANVGQLLELAAGKIAKKRGTPYTVKNFTPGALEQVKKDLEAEGLSDKEDLLDPKTGKTIPGVATGYAYQAKLKHQLDKKFSARQLFKDGYDGDEQPVGGAAIDNLTLHALAGHNARANMSEMARLKGTRNQDYWEDLAVGKRPKKVAKSPYSFNKLKAMMNGLGVNIEKRKDGLEMIPMTDREVERRSRGAFKDPGGFKSLKSGLKAFEYGLFDEKLVGRKGQNWNHIELPEPTPNPMFTKAVGLLLQEGAGTKSDDGKAKSVRIFKGNPETENRSKPISQIAFSDVEKVYRGDRALEIDGEPVRAGRPFKTRCAPSTSTRQSRRSRRSCSGKWTKRRSIPRSPTTCRWRSSTPSR